jgi:glycosyltransferase involved in cell wall biosynthesis
LAQIKGAFLHSREIVDMTCSVLVNNYNYAKYVCEAVKSILGQSVVPDEIIIVDDGSTDGSPGVLHDQFGHIPSVKIITGENKGQLASFNKGFLHSSGDIVFFLDADDLYETDYIETALSFYHKNPSCDFLICGRKEFGEVEQTVLKYKTDTNLGFSVISTLHARGWEGGPTSTLSMKRWVLNAFMPLPLEAFWRTRADDCLVYGASIVGAKKYYLAQPLVLYRIHSTNHFYGRNFDSDNAYKYSLHRIQLIDHISSKTSIYKNSVLNMIKKELKSSSPNAFFEKFKMYFKIINNADRDLTWKVSKLTYLLRLCFTYFVKRM